MLKNLTVLLIAAFAITSHAAPPEQTLILLRDTARKSLNTTNPHANAKVDGIFNGSYDWHSAVEAHFATLSMSRVLGQIDTVTLARFTKESVRTERERLQKTPEFELPYGQSWLLVLLGELHKEKVSAPVRAQLKLLEAETTKRIANWLQTNAFPDDQELSVCSGNYHSWIVTYTLASKSGVMNANVMAPFDQRASAFLCENQETAYDFVSVRALSAMAAHARSPEPRPFAKVLEIDPFDTPHEIGASVTEYWAIAEDAQTDMAARERFDAFIDQMIQQPQLWHDGYDSVTHWIPQFMWFGIWIEMGQP